MKSQRLAWGLLFALLASPARSENGTGADPAAYQAPDAQAAQELNSRYRAGGMTFSEYAQSMAALVHRAALAGPDQSRSQPTVRGGAQAGAQSVVSIDDPGGLLNSAERSAFWAALDLIPVDHWTGVKAIHVVGVTDLSVPLQFDAGPDNLTIQVPKPPAHSLTQELPLLASAVGLYFFRYNLDHLDPRIKQEFIENKGGESRGEQDFALGEANYLAFSGSPLIGPQSDWRNAGLLANYLFWAALFRVPRQALAYAYTITPSGLVRTTQTAYWTAHTVVYDGIEIAFDAAYQMTGDRLLGNPNSPFTPFDPGSKVILPIGARLLLSKTPPRPLPHPPFHGRKA